MFKHGVSILLLFILGIGSMDASTGKDRPQWLAPAISKLQTELIARYGESQRTRVNHGLKQVADFWIAEDGDQSAFEEFVKKSFAGDSASYNSLFIRFESILETIDGHMNEITLALRWQSDLDLGPIYPFDEILAAYSPSAHLNDDFFANKLAFVALLNFPLTTLDERLNDGPSWDRRHWAEVRIAQRFSNRIPSSVSQSISEAAAIADQYISEYNIWMHHIISEKGLRLFPEKMKLLSHWNLRDQIKADYADTKKGLARQRQIAKIMDRIVTQTIPAMVINNPTVDWNPMVNTVQLSTMKDYPSSVVSPDSATNSPEPDTRYDVLLKTFRASALQDPYSPIAPTLIARRFDLDREIPEQRVKAIFEQLLGSPLLGRTAALIKKRLERDLEPFDIWYNGFKPKSAYSESQLDSMVSQRYPTPGAFERDIPRILETFGFAKDRAVSIASQITVDPARGSGHAWGPQMRSAKAHLRTRVEKEGMNYKGFNIAVHELGHNVEQVISLRDIDHTSLSGVPNTAFTEAIAFVFQAHDLELLGLSSTDEQAGALKALNDYWMTCEIAAVALVDMEVWHWMYDHPTARAAELKTATLDIAKKIWNRYYAPVIGKKDIPLLAIYSHMIHSFLYLPDYPLGHLIAFQIEQQMPTCQSIGKECERILRYGRIAPDVWMRQATGVPVGADVLLKSVEKAFEVAKK